MRMSVLVLVAAIVAGCGGSGSTGAVAGSPSQSVVAPSTAASASVKPSPTATGPKAPATHVPTPSSSGTQASTCVTHTLGALTEAQRIGQLFMIGLAKDTLGTAERSAIATYHFGSVSFTTKTSIGVARVRAITDAVQDQATSAATGGVRFFVAANQEGGLVQALSGPGFDTIPSALSQGSLSTSTLKTRAARWGGQLRAAGVNVNLAPVADVVPPGTDATNAPIGKLKREYGHTPSTVASHVAAFIGGMKTARIATTAKHFPGLGRVVGNTDFTAAVTDTVTTVDDPYLQPFTRAIETGVPIVMVSLATYERIDPDHLAVFSPAVIQGLLRDKLEVPRGRRLGQPRRDRGQGDPAGGAGDRLPRRRRRPHHRQRAERGRPDGDGDRRTRGHGRRLPGSRRCGRREDPDRQARGRSPGLLRLTSIRPDRPPDRARPANRGAPPGRGRRGRHPPPEARPRRSRR